MKIYNIQTNEVYFEEVVLLKDSVWCSAAENPTESIIEAGLQGIQY